MIREVSLTGEPIPEPEPLILEPLTDPEEIARHHEAFAAAQKNSAWLEQHWPDLLPQVLGKCVAVAGQEAFIADTPEEAMRLAREAHPDDKGMIGKYVSPLLGPKIYGIRG